MALSRQTFVAGDIIYGLSTDAKPVPIITETFIERDTSKFFKVVRGVFAEIINPTYVNKAGSLTQITTRKHSDLQNLSSDDHTQYALLAGRSGGQTLIGGTGTTDNLILRSTSGVGTTGADIIFQVGNNGATVAMKILNSGFVGIGINNPAVDLDLQKSKVGGNIIFRVFNSDNTNSASHAFFNSVVNGANAGDPKGLFNISGVTLWALGADNSDSDKFKIANNVDGLLETGTILTIDTSGRVGIGTVSPAGKLQITQPSLTGAIPVLTLEQLDVSEQFFDFISTIGVGNAIEAVGAKVLSTTHFIKITIPGGLTRYIPCGTIA